MACLYKKKSNFVQIEDQKRANEQLKEENQRWKDIVSEIEHKKVFYFINFEPSILL